MCFTKLCECRLLFNQRKYNFAKQVSLERLYQLFLIIICKIWLHLVTATVLRLIWSGKHFAFASNSLWIQENLHMNSFYPFLLENLLRSFMYNVLITVTWLTERRASAECAGRDSLEVQTWEVLDYLIRRH